MDGTDWYLRANVRPGREGSKSDRDSRHSKDKKKWIHLIVARLCPQVTTTTTTTAVNGASENEADNNKFDELLFGRMIEPQI